MSVRTAHVFEEKWRSQDVTLQEDADFSSLLLSEKVLSGLTKAGYKKPSPIQLQAIPSGRFGQDLVVQAKAGTGKTLVFTVVSLEMLMDVHRPQVLILSPTREIAFQICSVIQAVGSEFEDLKCCTFIGGTPFAEDKEKAQSCQIAVGTPGRMHQLITSGFLKTNSIRLFVLDEADQLLESSFQSSVDSIFQTLPKEKQVIATSATYPKKLKKLVHRYFREPFITRLNVKDLTLLGTVHYTQTVQTSQMTLLAYKLKLTVLEDILSTIKFSQCLIFCNLISRVESLCSDVKKWGFSATYISSAKEQTARLKAIDTLKRFKCKVLVSSDVTSRGIDAENVDLVINFDCPEYTEVYLHRVGRAGRYGSKGVAITFLTEKESSIFKNIEDSGAFQSYILPDPLPENLINIRPDGSVKKDAFEEQDSSSSDEEEESTKVADIVLECSESNSQNLNFTKGSDSIQNGDLEDNISQPTCSKACQNNCTEIDFVESELNSCISTEESIAKMNTKEDIKITSLIVQNIEPSLCQSSYAELESHKKTHSGEFECSKSVLSVSRESAGTCETLEPEICSLTEDEYQDGSVKEGVIKIDAEPELYDKKNSLNKLKYPKTVLSSELEIPCKSLETEISSPTEDDKCQNSSIKEHAKKIHASVLNLIPKEIKKSNELGITENLKENLNPASLNENHERALGEKKAISSNAIMHLKDSLNQYYCSVFNSFKEECVNVDECLANFPQGKVLNEIDQMNEVTTNKAMKECFEVDSNLASTDSLGVQKSNESKCQNSKQSVTFGKVENVSNVINSDASEKAAKTVLENTQITSVDVKGNTYHLNIGNASSSDESDPTFSGKNMLMLHKAWKDVEKDLCKKTTTRFKEFSKRHSVLKKTESDNTSDSFELDSVTSSESSVCSQNLYSTPVSLKPLKSSSLSTNSSESSKSSSRLPRKSYKTSKYSNKSSISSSASSESFSNSPLKTHKSSSSFSESSSDSDTSSVISEGKRSKDCGQSQKWLKSSSNSSISSGNHHLSKQQLSPHVMQQNRHKSTFKKKSHPDWNNEVYKNSPSGYDYSSNIHGISTSCEEGNNTVHGNSLCAYQNMYMCGLHTSNHKHSNCGEPLSHSHNLLHSSSYQSAEFNDLYATFQRQWEHIYYFTYFQ